MNNDFEKILGILLVIYISFSDKSWLEDITIRKILSHYVTKIVILVGIVLIGSVNFLLGILLLLAYSVTNDYLNTHDWKNAL